MSVQRAFEVLDKIQAEGAVVDPVAISQTVQQTTHHSDSVLINTAMLVLIASWFTGIIHAYIMGKKKDQQETPNN